MSVKRLIVSVVFSAVAWGGLAGPVKAGVIISHQGDTDPTTENFGLWPFNGGIATAALANDNGLAAWQIANTSSSDQQAYYNQLGGTGPFDPGGSGLTQQQANAINANGFVMSLRARIVQGPTYDPNGTQKVSTDITVAGFNGSRYDIGLGSDGNGNTLVVLPTAVTFNRGTFFSFTPFGSPLLVPGNGYHLYQLSYNPGTGTAALFVDGVLRVTGYGGTGVNGGATANNYGLAFGSTDGATSNFNLAELDSGQLTVVPEPGSLALCGSGLVGFLSYGGWRRRRQRTA
jgi:hypothetical protein